MTQFAAYVSLTLVTVSLMHVALTARFFWITRKHKSSSPQIRFPKTAVVLSLRGADAYLPQALRGLLTQNYPDYCVQIVVDSEHDPAYEVARQIVDECQAGHARLSVLKSRRTTCSLKCNALIQAVTELDASFEYVAFMDADVVPHATWLQDLVAPLDDPRVGATTGNRWYIPDQRLWGSLVRVAWNGSAVMQMAVFSIAWGGTMAIRHSLVRESDLLEKWGRSFNDDIVTAEAVRGQGQQLRFVPALVMVNREDTAWKPCLAWVTRQLFHTRFYQRNWEVVAGLGLASMALILAACALAVSGVLTGEFSTSLTALGGLTAYFCVMAALWLAISFRIRQFAQDRVECVNVIGWRYLLPAVIGAHVVYGAGLCLAMASRTITWRGITYRVDGPWQVQLVDDLPYERSTAAQHAGLSL